MDFTVSYEITNQQVSDLLLPVLQNSPDWMGHESHIEPTVWKFNTYPDKSSGFHWLQDYPLNPGGAVILRDENNKRLVLDHDAVKKGLILMAQRSPADFADIFRHNIDAETSDIFLQYCVLGKIVY